ncbi:MAG: hypothetical protein QW103_00955, partial [Candidatus Pacearchaeota archaeon]
KMKKKKGQLTIFIIIGVIFVFLIFFLFYYLRPEFIEPVTSILGLKKKNFEDCLDQSISKKIQELSLKAGFVNPQFKHSYKGENYTFLCYTKEYLKNCVVQEPFLKDRFEDSLKEILKGDLETCYSRSIKELERRGLDIESGEIVFNVSIEPKEIIIRISAPTKIYSEDISSSFKDLKYSYKTNLYQVLMIVTSLIQFETYYGDSEQMQHMFYYPNIKILKTRLDDDIKVYSVIEKNEGIKFNFAVRSLTFPPGGVNP